MHINELMTYMHINELTLHVPRWYLTHDTDAYYYHTMCAVIVPGTEYIYMLMKWHINEVSIKQKYNQSKRLIYVENAKLKYTLKILPSLRA